MKRLVTLVAAMGIAFPVLGEAQVAVSGSTVREHEAAPGSRHGGSIRIRNTSASPQEVRIHLADYEFSADGRTRFPDPSSHPRSNAEWISVDPALFVVPPGESVSVSYTLEVPTALPEHEQTSPWGTYWSVIIVEAVEPTDSAGAQAGGFTVRSRIRTAIQLATHIESTGDHGVDLGDIVVSPGKHGIEVSVDLLNDGERAYRPEIELRLYAPSGEPLGAFQQQRGLLYPGSSLRQNFDLGELPPGTYEALVVIDTNGPELFGAQLRFDL